MKENIFLKKLSTENMFSELNTIGFDKTYINTALYKYKFRCIKIFNLRAVEANILKQIALSSGTDCAVNKNVVTANIELSDCVLAGSIAQLNIVAEKLQKQPFGLKKLSKMIFEEIKNNDKILKLKNKIYNLSKQKLIMGIVNLTPDSFSDGGKFKNTDEVLEYVHSMLSHGADIIDIGAESTKPDAVPVDSFTEQKRLLGIFSQIRKTYPEAILSVDTYHADTAQQVIDAGVDIINDISGNVFENEMIDIVAKNNVAYILTDNQNNSTAKNSCERSFTDNVFESLYKKNEYLLSAGLKSENIIIDVGIGFGKKNDENFELIKNINDFSSLKHPVLVGHSRKSFLRINEHRLPSEYDDVTSAISLHLLSHNADILRVHNIEKTKQIIDIWEKLYSNNF